MKSLNQLESSIDTHPIERAKGVIRTLLLDAIERVQKTAPLVKSLSELEDSINTCPIERTKATFRTLLVGRDWEDPPKEAKDRAR